MDNQQSKMFFFFKIRKYQDSYKMILSILKQNQFRLNRTLLCLLYDESCDSLSSCIFQGDYFSFSSDAVTFFKV